jgi:autotransporter family porin
MRSRTIITRLALALALTLSLGAPAASHAASGAMGTTGVKKLSPQKRAGKSVTFRVGRIQPQKIKRGYIRSGRYERRIRTRMLRRAAGRRTAARRKIAVRIPARVALRRQRVRLVVLMKPRTSKPRHRDPVGVIEQPAPETTPAVTEPQQTAPTEPTTSPDSEATPATEPAPAPAEAASGEKATTRPVGSPILSDAEAAAHVRRSSWEPRPGNATANQRVPQPGELDAFMKDNISVYSGHKALVTGNFTGTTDEIIQWAAWKWGLDEDVFRAVVTNESWWRMSAVGDGGLSYGLTQIKTTFHAGTYPLSNTSTAFNVDYYGALFRYYFDGHARWLNDMDKGQNYAAGDMWGAVGAHYAGRWHTDAANGYIADVKRHLDQRTWETADFR